MSLMASSLVLVAALAVSVTTTTAYPTKDDEAYYYSRLHDVPDNYYKETRNLDGIGVKDELPLFAIVAKREERPQKGSENVGYGVGSGSHVDSLGGGHLVRGQQSEQGVRHYVVNRLQPAVGVGSSGSFGVIRKFPEESRHYKYNSGDAHNFEVSKGYEGDPNTRSLLNKNSWPNSVGHKSLKEFESLGKGYLLASRRDLDSLGGGHLLGSRRDLDSLGGGHLLGSRRGLDYLGGGHLLGSRRDIDSLGEDYILGPRREHDPVIKGNRLKGIQTEFAVLKDVESVSSKEIQDDKNYAIEAVYNCSSFNRLYNLIKRYLQATYKIRKPNSITSNGDGKCMPSEAIGPNSREAGSEVQKQIGKIAAMNNKPETNQDITYVFESFKEPYQEIIVNKDSLEEVHTNPPFKGAIELNKVYFP